MTNVVSFEAFQKAAANREETKTGTADVEANTETPVFRSPLDHPAPPQTVRRYAHHFNLALRELFVGILRDVAEHGLVDDTHALYMMIDVQQPGVVLPDSVRAANPEICTLVLQHQFYDLCVDHDLISVTMSFSGRPFRVEIPVAAVVTLSDPSVNFMMGLVDPALFQQAS